MQRVALTMSREVECLLGTLKIEAQVEWSESPVPQMAVIRASPTIASTRPGATDIQRVRICDLAPPALRRSTSRSCAWALSPRRAAALLLGWKKRGHADLEGHPTGPVAASTLSPPAAIRCGQVSTTSSAPQQATSGLCIDKLNKEINAGLANPKLKARFADLGATMFPLGSPAAFSKFVADETEKYAKVVKFAGWRTHHGFVEPVQAARPSRCCSLCRPACWKCSAPRFAPSPVRGRSLRSTPSTSSRPWS